MARVALIILVTLWIYLPVINGDWLWDDKPLIHDNAYYIQSTNGLWHIWADPGHSPDSDPLLQTAEWFQWRLWHNHTAGYHLVNIALHILSALLVWRLFERLGLRLAWLGGLLFAIQPIHVESVAWMAELKNTLSLPPFLLSMIAWIDSDRAHRRVDYVAAISWFLVAMLCKPAMAMFPLVLLLHAWWKRGRIAIPDLITSAPLFAVSLLIGGLAWWFQQAHAFKDLTLLVGGIGARTALAGTVIVFYLRQCLVPVSLLPMYDRWSINPPSAIEFLPWLVLVAVLVGAWVKRATWGRHVILGLGFFLINLAPFIGLTIPYFMTFSWVADHVLYIPSIGITALLVAGIAAFHDSPRRQVRALIAVGATIYCMALAVIAHGYSAWFTDQATLWTNTLARNPEAWPAHQNLGNILARTGHREEAITHFRKAIELNSAAPEIYLSLGNALLDSGQVDAAVEQYQAALTLSKDYAPAHLSLGMAYARLKRMPEAIEQYQLTVRLDPANKQAHLDLADLLAQQGRDTEALEQYKAALQNEPSYQDFLKDEEKLKSATH